MIFNGFSSVFEQPLISVCSFVHDALHTYAIDPFILRLNIRKALREDVQLNLPISPRLV